MSSGDEAGLRFTEPKKIINTTGEVKDVQIIANGLYIVITIVESLSGSTYIRAATGIMRADLTHEFKPCEKVLVVEEIIDVYTIFTESASEDHVYVKVETTRLTEKLPLKSKGGRILIVPGLVLYSHTVFFFDGKVKRNRSIDWEQD